MKGIGIQVMNRAEERKSAKQFSYHMWIEGGLKLSLAAS